MFHYQKYSFFSRFKTQPILSYTRCACQVFEQKHPFFIGTLYWFSGLFARSFPISSCSLIIVLTLFTPPKKLYKQLFWYLLWMLAACCFSYSPPHQGSVCASFVITTKQYKHKKHHIYQANASFIMPCCNKKTKPLPCRIQSQIPLSKDFKYTAQGYLAKQNSLFTFTPIHIEKPPLSKGLMYKQSIRNYLQQILASRFSDTQCADFASSLILGTPLPESLNYLFRQKGLAHIFVVSGWHFSLFFLFVTYLIAPIAFRYRPYVMLISFAVLAYILPWSPSVCRVWISYSLYCLSLLTQGQASNLNRLDLSAIICSFFFSPMSPSFVLSFLATLGILLFYSPLLHFLTSSWGLSLSSFWKKFSLLFISPFTLSLSSQLFIYIPSLIFFRVFHLDGLLMNIFFPLIITPIFFLIILSLFIPPLAILTQTGIQTLLTLPVLHTPNILISLQIAPKNLLNFTFFSLIIFLLGVILQRTHTLSSDSDSPSIL